MRFVIANEATLRGDVSKNLVIRVQGFLIRYGEGEREIGLRVGMECNVCLGPASNSCVINWVKDLVITRGSES